MEGVKTAILAFLLICLILPGIVRNRKQYYLALIAYLLGLLLHVVAEGFSSPWTYEPGGSGRVPPLWRVCHTLGAFLDILTVIVLVLAAGGLRVRELASNIVEACQALRRPDAGGSVIVPLTGEQPAPREQEQPAPARYVLDEQAGPPDRGPGPDLRASSTSEPPNGPLPLV